MSSPHNPAKTKVLVVDDQAIIADTLTLILNQSGFQAAAAYRGQQAVLLAAQSSPDVLLIDIVMDDMTGIETALAIAKAHPACRILFISGHGDAAGMMDRYAPGLDCQLLPKPLRPEELLAVLARTAHKVCSLTRSGRCASHHRIPARYSGRYSDRCSDRLLRLVRRIRVVAHGPPSRATLIVEGPPRNTSPRLCSAAWVYMPGIVCSRPPAFPRRGVILR